ncbi:hypothetical protein [Actinoplanes philippinensis]|uniref:hypothetical protein n=1 Tax=Actinoplanes philippinensis TaxID=35752 RepID=UPI00340B68FC
MTSQEPPTTPDTDTTAAETEVIAVPEPAPVFVDSTGRRSRLLRRVALAFGVLLVAYGGLVTISLAGGPVSSSAVLPLPGFDDEDEDPEPDPKPQPTPAPTPTPSVSPARRIESAVRDGGDQRRPVASTSAKASTKASRSAKPTATPSASSGSPTPRPLESATATQQPTVEPNPPTSGPATPGVPPHKPQP